MKAHKNIIAIIIMLWGMRILHGVEAIYYDPQLLTDETVWQGHLYFKNGATVGNGQVSVITFHSNGVLDGRINFNTPGGTASGSRIVLEHDLILGSTATLTSSNSAATFQSSGSSLTLTGSLVLDNRIYVSGDLTLNGQGNTVELSGANGGFYLAYENSHTSTLRLKNMQLLINAAADFIQSASDGVHSSTVGTLELENVVIRVENGLSRIGGIYLNIRGMVEIQGNNQHFHLYQLQSPSQIASQSALRIGPGATLVIDPGNGGSEKRTTFKCADTTSLLWLDNCTLRVIPPGWQLTNGQLLFDGKVVVENFTDSINYVENNDVNVSFEIGNDGVREAQATLLPGAQVEVKGYFYHNPL